MVTDAGEGIAVTGLNSSTGTWQYSTDGGSTWTAVGAVANNSALLLKSTDYLRLVPSGSGSTASVTFCAWDQTSGTDGSKVDTTTNGGNTAFSTATATSNINVLASTMTTVSPSIATTTYGNSVTFTATVSASGTPTGTVTFDDNGTIIGTGTLSSGTATFTTSALAAGTHTITAVYSGDGNYVGSTSSGVIETVNQAALTITANNQTKVYGAALPTLTASYTGFVNGDTSASLTTQPTLTTTATAASHVAGSPYAITASGRSTPTTRSATSPAR